MCVSATVLFPIYYHSARIQLFSSPHAKVVIGEAYLGHGDRHEFPKTSDHSIHRFLAYFPSGCVHMSFVNDLGMVSVHRELFEVWKLLEQLPNISKPSEIHDSIDVKAKFLQVWVQDRWS